MAGIGEAEGDAECGLYLLFAQQATDTSAEAICAVEVQKTLKQYFANYFRDRQIAKEIVFLNSRSCTFRPLYSICYGFLFKFSLFEYCFSVLLY